MTYTLSLDTIQLPRQALTRPGDNGSLKERTMPELYSTIILLNTVLMLGGTKFLELPRLASNKLRRYSRTPGRIVRANWSLLVIEAVTRTYIHTNMAANGDPITLEDGWGYVQTKVIGPLKVRRPPPTRLSVPPTSALLGKCSGVGDVPVLSTPPSLSRARSPRGTNICTRTHAHTPYTPSLPLLTLSRTATEHSG